MLNKLSKVITIIYIYQFILQSFNLGSSIWWKLGEFVCLKLLIPGTHGLQLLENMVLIKAGKISYKRTEFEE